LPADPRWLAVAPGALQAHSALAVLLETGDDVLGVLLLYGSRPGVFNDDHLRLVEAAGNQLAASINNAELYAFIRAQAEQLGDMVREQQIEATKSNAILEGVADGVVVANEQGGIILVNNAAEVVLSLRRADILGKPVDRVAGLFTQGGERWADTIATWIAHPLEVHGGDTLTEIVRAGERVISLTLAPVMIRDQFLGTVSVLRDITRDVEVDRLKSEFISNISHELRTPMTSIKGYADLLVLGMAGPVSERQREFLDTIKHNADRLGTLVDDLLNISQIDSSRLTMDWQPVAIPALISTLVGDLRARIASNDRELTVVEAVAEGLPETYADPDKVKQLLGRLLDNAYQYTPDGGTITVAARLEGADRFLIAVSDTGIGIPEAVLPRVFERFFRNDEHPLVIETPGTGLGLALARELAEMHHGTIAVESVVDQGSTFTFALPLVVEPPSEPGA
jgi:PAS domain S-box-containing protein